MGISRLGFPRFMYCGSRRWDREQARSTGSRLDGGAGISVARAGGYRRWPVVAAEGWGRVAHRLLAVRKDRAESRGARSVRGVDVESARALRLPHSGSLSVRHVFGEKR